MTPREPHKKSPQHLPKEIAARNLLLLEQPPVILGARLRKTTFTQFLRLESTRKLFACGDSARVRRKIIGDKSMNKEVTLQELRGFTRKQYGKDQRGIAYWQRVAKILWLGYSAYLVMRVVAAKAVDAAIGRGKKEARRKLAERKRLMERHKRESARHKRWGQRA